MKKQETEKHILVVEDEAEHAELLSRGFERESGTYRVTVASTIAIAREFISQRQPDLALVDYRLPDGGGDSVITLGAGLFPVVMMTSHGDEHLAVQAIKAGALDYIVKSPTTFNDITLLVGNALLEWKLLTELKSAEEKLRKSEEQYRIVLHTAMDGFWLVNNQGFLTDVNETYCLMSGYSKKELLTMSIFDLEAIEGDDQTLNHMDLIINNGEQRFETQHRRKNGTVYDVEVSVQYRSDFEGGFVCFVKNITEQKLLRKSLRQSVERYHLLIQKATDGVLYLSMEYAIISANEAFTRMHGYTEQEIVNLKLNDLQTLVTIKQMPAMRNKMLSGGMAVFEAEHIHKSGRIIPIEISSSIVTINDETIIQLFCRDISERKIMNDKLRNSERFVRSIVDSLSSQIATLDETGTIITVNSAWRNVATNNLVNGDTVCEGVNYLAVCDAVTGAEAQNAHTIAAGIRAVIQGDQVKYIHDYACDTPDEQRIFTATVTRFMGSGPIRVVVAHEDVTDRMQMQNALTDSLGKFQSVFENSNDALMLLSEKGYFECNTKALEMFGISSKEEFAKFQPIQLSAPVQPDGTESGKASVKHVAKAYRNGTDNFEWLHRRLNGEEFFADVMLSTFNYRGSRLIQATVRDISMRKNMEHDLLDSENFLRKVTDNMPGMVGYWTKELVCTFANKHYLEWFGYTPAEMIGLRMQDVLGDELFRKNELFIRNALRGEDQMFERQLTKVDGTIGLTLVHYISHRVHDGVAGFFVLIADITEIKRGQEKSRLSDAALSSISQGVIITDHDGIILSANKAVEAITGYAGNDLTGVNCQVFHGPLSESGTVKTLLEALKKSNQFFGEILLYRKDSRTFWSEVTISPVVTEQRQTTHFVFVIRDISERMLAEKELRDREEKYRGLVMYSNDPIFSFNPDETYRFVNEAFARRFGKTPEDFIGKTPHDVFFHDEAENRLELVRKVFKTRETNEVESQIVDKRGATVYYVTTADPVKDNQGRVLYVSCISKDITERKNTELRLRQLSQAVEQSPASVMITDTEGLLRYVNPKFVEITGYHPGEVLGNNPRFLKSGLMPPEEYIRLWNDITSGKTWKGEFHNKKKNGELFWELATISPILNAQGETTHYIAIKEDITERKKADEERERMIAELQEALEQIKTLKGIVPICANCKQIRDDEGFWQQVESYVEKHTEAQFSHGICPVCVEKLYPKYAKKLKK